MMMIAAQRFLDASQQFSFDNEFSINAHSMSSSIERKICRKIVVFISICSIASLEKVIFCIAWVIWSIDDCEMLLWILAASSLKLKRYNFECSQVKR